MNAEIRFQYNKKLALKKKITNSITLLPFALGILLLVPAGSISYWQVYVYIAILFIPFSYTLFYFYNHDPEFLEQRMIHVEKEKQQKKIVSVTGFLLFVGYIVVGFDHRFCWSQVPLVFEIIAYCIVFLSYVFVIHVFKNNRYASRIIKVDDEQVLITKGPYRYFRHPMYTGMIFLFLFSPIALGSYWALIPVSALPFSLILRILNEEKILLDELEGYEDYCQKTRFRLIPYVW